MMSAAKRSTFSFNNHLGEPRGFLEGIANVAFESSSLKRIYPWWLSFVNGLCYVLTYSKLHLKSVWLQSQQMICLEYYVERGQSQ